jgi:hypothetical protein
VREGFCVCVCVCVCRIKVSIITRLSRALNKRKTVPYLRSTPRLHILCKKKSTSVCLLAFLGTVYIALLMETETSCQCSNVDNRHRRHTRVRWKNPNVGGGQSDSMERRGQRGESMHLNMWTRASKRCPIVREGSKRRNILHSRRERGMD